MSYVRTGRGLGASTSSTIEASIGSSLASAAPLAGPAAPILAVAAGIAEMLAALGVGSGCGQTCVLSSNYANQAAALLQQNLDAYFAIAPPRSPADQQAAEQNYQTIWNDLVQQCGNPQLGQAGENCISEREEGACYWHQTGQPQYPGQPALGACWNWYDAYLAPILQDSDVAPATSTAAASTSSTASPASTSSGSLESIPSWMWAAAALGIVALVVM